MVIFIFQTVWLFIDDLAGKDLDLLIIGKFLFYLMPNLTEKVLPLTVLLSSILTFGSFAENYEFAAMKASGISLQRAMRSLIVFVILLGGVTFFFANNVIPASEQKIFNMRRNIAKIKPAAVIVEGVFSDIEGTEMNIKVAKKSGEKDRFLEDVIIHQKSASKVNSTVIKAKSGELISSETSDIIQLVLNDGHYYEEMQPKGAKEKRKKPFTRAKFETYTKNIDVSSLNDQNIEEESNITTDKMKNVIRLNKDIDSLKKNNLKQVKAFSKNITARMGAFPAVPKDSISKRLKKYDTPQTKKSNDTIAGTGDIISVLPEWQKVQMYSNAKNKVKTILNTVSGKKQELGKRYEVYNRHILSLHKKFALAFSCIILFFVGAPLGAIIRKGGLGLPMVVAIILFLAYYFIGVFADNYAKKGAMHPILGAWLSTLIMMPLGVSLTKRATADKGLMSFANGIDKLVKLFKKKEEEENQETSNSQEEYNKINDALRAFNFSNQSPEFKTLEFYSDERLTDIVQNHKQYGMQESFRYTAIKILENRNITLKQLQLSGNLINSKFERATAVFKIYKKRTDIALVAYLYLVLVWPFASLMPVPEIAMNVLYAVILIVYLFFVVKSAMTYSEFYKVLDKKEKFNPGLAFFFGSMVFIITYFYIKKELSTEIKNIK